MGKNMNEHKGEHNKQTGCKESWVKFVFITLAVFFGCYLATYCVLHHAKRECPFSHSPIPDIDNVIKEQDKMFKDMESIPVGVRVMLPANDPVVQTFEEDGKYRVIIDLKPFNNDIKNVTIDIKSDHIGIKGEMMASNADENSDYKFSQSFSLPQKINVKKVSREVKDNKYILTLPVMDDED